MNRRRILVWGVAGVLVSQFSGLVSAAVIQKNTTGTTPASAADESTRFSNAVSLVFQDPVSSVAFIKSPAAYFAGFGVSAATVGANEKLIKVIEMMYENDFLTSVEIGDVEYIMDRSADMKILSARQKTDWMRELSSEPIAISGASVSEIQTLIDKIGEKISKVFLSKNPPKTIESALVIALAYAIHMTGYLTQSSVI